MNLKDVKRMAEFVSFLVKLERRVPSRDYKLVRHYHLSVIQRVVLLYKQDKSREEWLHLVEKLRLKTDGITDNFYLEMQKNNNMIDAIRSNNKEVI